MKQTITDFSILIVDNASENESIKKITSYFEENQYPFNLIRNNDKHTVLNRIFIIESKDNRGFSAGNNAGFNFIKTNLICDKIILLNNDTVVPNDFVEIMEKEYARLSYGKNQLIALGASEYNYYTKELSHRGIQHLNLMTGLTFKINIFPSLKYICGACIMVDANAPLMDETYFLYYEDAQYSKTLKQFGYKLYTTNKTRYFHKISATTSTITHKLNYQFTSMWHFFRLNYPFLIPVVFTLRFSQQLFCGKIDKNKLLISTFKKERQL